MTIETTKEELQKAFRGFDFPAILSGRFSVHQLTPAITPKGYREMNFGLIPSWSKVRRPKFATHNARLFSEKGEPIHLKPTWKGPFSKSHGIIPISQFVEPIYTGEFAGKMVRFSTDELLFAAAICDTWVDKETGEIVESFSILTDDPVPFVEKIGHDRTPIFLPANAASEWLLKKETPETLIQFLRSQSLRSEKWKVEIDRAMKPGWEKRVGLS